MYWHYAHIMPLGYQGGNAEMLFRHPSPSARSDVIASKREVLICAKSGIHEGPLGQPVILGRSRFLLLAFWFVQHPTSKVYVSQKRIVTRALTCGVDTCFS